MSSKRARLDRFISGQQNLSLREARLLVSQGRVAVDGACINDATHLVNQFSLIKIDRQVIQANTPRYIVMNKPAGVVSATKDDKHQTILDVLRDNYQPVNTETEIDFEELHIAGRLDFNSTGLVLLTNDGQWSRNISKPENRIRKTYIVGLDTAVKDQSKKETYIKSFTEGMAFDYEGITTRPASLTFVDDQTAKVGLEEGRYHQIKRMFGHFNNRVMTLERIAIGSLQLDSNFHPGQCRDLSACEIKNLTTTN